MAFGASEAARFQAYQTRARMGAQLWGGVLMFTLLGWVALTMYVVWRQTGEFFPQLGHQYFWRWVICGVFTHTPLIDTIALRCSVPADGAWYPVGPLTDWMNSREMYRLPFPTWFWHYGIRTALVPIGLGAIALVWRSRHTLDALHIRGLRLLTPREHNRQLNGGFIRQMFNHQRGIQLGSSTIPANKECEHFLITGSPGAGKSTLIRQMLSQVRDRTQSAIVLDVDAEFIQEFFDEDRGDVVLNPLDARCPFWSPWLEFRDESFTMDAEAMAASLIRGASRTPTEEFFRDSARTLIESIFEKVKDRRHSGGIADFLALPRPEMHEKLSGTRAYPLVDEHAAEQGTGIISVAANATKAFYHLPRREQTNRIWSARQWAASREGWVFLPSTEDARAAIQSLQGVWLDSLVRWLMSAEIGSEQVWIFADELPAMGYQNQIEQLITRGRKRGLAVVIGFQNVSQLRAIYGRDRAVTLTSSPTTKAILRVDEPETAQWASDLLGSREIERTEMTMLAGLSNMREGVNLQARRLTEHIVTPAEVQLLKPFNGYLCVAGNDRTRLTIPERHLEKHHPAFIPRTRSTAAARVGE
jgi:energy-coupling factor transporter ATP-binding protein EcfA2